MPRVVVCECRQLSGVPVHRTIQDHSWVTVAVDDGNTLLSMLTQHGADVLVIGLCVESGEQIGVLRLARRILPGVPVIIVASAASEITEAQLRGLGVSWYGVLPVNPVELRQAVSSALMSRRVEFAHRLSRSGGNSNDRPIGRKDKGDNS